MIKATRSEFDFSKDPFVRLKDKEIFLTQKSIDDISFKIFNKNNIFTTENNYGYWRSIIAFAYAGQGSEYLFNYSPNRLREFINNTIGYITIKRENTIPDSIIIKLAIGKEIYKDISDVPDSFIDDDFIRDSFDTYYTRSLKKLFKSKARHEYVYREFTDY